MMDYRSRTVDQFRLGNEEEEGMLSSLVLTKAEAARAFWSPLHEEGKQIIDAVAGVIFDDATKAEMALQRKAPIQIPELWPKAQAMIGLAYLSMKGGAILAQDGDDAPDVETMNRICKIIDNENNIKRVKMECIRDAMLTGCPQFVVWDRPTDHLAGKTLEARRPAWRMGFLDPLCRDTSRLSDCRYIVFQHLVDKDQCLQWFPERKEQVERGFAGLTDWPSEDLGLTVNDRNTIFSAIKAGETQVNTTGTQYLLEMFSRCIKRVRVWASPATEQHEILPSDWAPEQVQAWQQQNPEYVPVDVDVPVWYVTTVLMTGQVLENKPHWFQEGMFPGACLVPQFHDEKPISPLRPAMQNLRLQALAKTEHIHSIRLSTDGLTLVREGAVKNEDELNYEMSRPGGKIIVRRGVPFNDAILRVPNQREQIAWRDVYLEASDVNDRMTVDRNVEGAAQSSQESGKVVQLRVSQVQNKSAQYMQAINDFNLQLERVKLRMLPYVITGEQVFQYVDEESKQVQEIAVNQPVEYDMLGDPLKIVNNLDGAKYDYVAVETDDSVTGRMNELEQFGQIMAQFMPSVPPDLWLPVLTKLPNAIAQEIAREIKKQQEAQANAPKSPEAKVFVNIPMDKASFDPIVQEAARNVGVLSESAPPVEPPTQEQSGSAPAGAMQ